MSDADFGSTPDGRRTRRFTLRSDLLEVAVSDYGATLLAVRAPDRDGRVGDVVLGHDHLDGYLHDNPYLGASVGRVANRIGGASFACDGVTYRLLANDGPNHLHGGGDRALSRVVWDVVDAAPDRLALAYVSPDGEEGYPGRLEVSAEYALDGDTLAITYRARTDAVTPVSLTNHAYFHLGGQPGGDVLDHEVQVFARAFTPTGPGQIPTGEIAEVTGTPLDLREPTRIGDGLPALVDTEAAGFDHNFVVDGTPGEVRPAAQVLDPASGRTLAVQTDQPGVQFYSGNMLDGSAVGRGGVTYGRHAGLCLEPQQFPDAVNLPQFPSPWLAPGEEHLHRSSYRFGTA